VRGRGADRAFADEAGGHRWQRVPPTEKRGRVHTSTVTVAVLPEPRALDVRENPRDVDESFVRGSGPGGQHRNKTSTAVQLVHRPSGIRVHVDGGRSQDANRQLAAELLRARLAAEAAGKATATRNDRRRRQIGAGMRGEKVRTIAEQRGRVMDHRTGKRTTLRRYLRGFVRDLR